MEFLAVISEESMIPLCRKYGVDYCMYKNKPLGEKKNAGLTYAFTKQWDWIIELGSDDLLKNEFLEIYKPYFEYNDLLGINNVAYINAENGDCRQMVSNSCFGLGRAVQRDPLELASRGVEVMANEDIITPVRQVNKGKKGFFPREIAMDLERVGHAKIISGEKYKIWHDGQQKGLDNHSTFFMAHNGILEKKVQCGIPVGIDIKSRENIWAYNPTVGEPMDLKLCLEGLSNDEQSAIVGLIKKNKALEVGYA